MAVGIGEGRKKLSTIEVMDTETLQWSTASSLPLPLFRSSLTLCGDQVYMLGGWDQDGGKSKSVFTCSLADLLHFCQPLSLRARLKTWSQASEPEVWHQLFRIFVQATILCHYFNLVQYLDSTIRYRYTLSSIWAHTVILSQW